MTHSIHKTDNFTYNSIFSEISAMLDYRLQLEEHSIMLFKLINHSTSSIMAKTPTNDLLVNE